MTKTPLILPIIMLSAFAFSGCAKSVKVTPLAEVEESGRFGRGGVKICLPKTMLTVTVPVTRSETTDAPYGELAPAFVGLEPLKPKDPSYSLGEVTVSAFGRRDERQTYWAEFPGGPFVSNEMTLQLNEEGVLTQGTSGQDNKTADFVVSTIETVGKIGGTLAKGVSARASSGGSVALAEHFLIFKGKKDEKYRNDRLQANVLRLLAMDESTRRKALVDGNDELRSDWSAWNEVSPEFERLVRAVEDIDNLRQSLRSAVSSPFESVEVRDAALSNIKTELNKRLALFVGMEKKTTWPARWTIEPSDFSASEELNPGDTETLFHLVTKGTPAGLGNIRKGFTPPLPEDFFIKCSGGDPVRVVLKGTKPTGGGAFPSVAKRDGSLSFRYRLPAETVVTVWRGSSQVGRHQTRVAQYGRIAYLPRGTGSSSTKWDITLDPVTGAASKVALVNKAFEPNLVRQAGGGVNDALTGVAARNAVDKDLLAAQRDAQIAKAQLDALQARKKLREELEGPQ